MPDSVNNVLSLAPDGSVSADFSGRIGAGGLDLDLAVGGVVPPQNSNRIQWKRVLDGAARAGLLATQLSGNTDTITDLYAQSPANASHQADVIAHAADSVLANTRVDVKADAQQRTLLDSAGNSDYLRGDGFTSLPSNSTWSTGLWGGAGNGSPFTAISDKALLINYATCYSSIGGSPRIEVYVSGVYKGTMGLNSVTPQNARFLLAPLHFVMATVVGTTYWVWFRIIAGDTSNDLGGTIVIQ